MRFCFVSIVKMGASVVTYFLRYKKLKKKQKKKKHRKKIQKYMKMHIKKAYQGFGLNSHHYNFKF